MEIAILKDIVLSALVEEEESMDQESIILDQEMARRVVNIEQEHGDRLIKIEIEAKPRNLMIVQVYMPTTDSDDEEIEHMYEKIEKLIKSEKSN